MRMPDVVFVQGGRFAMGSARGRPDEAPVHEVHVGAFRLGRTPITNAEYAACVAVGRVAEPPVWRDAAFSAEDRPVVGVSWFEASAYCAWLSEVSGACWRLPTEAEWECAMRGGLRGAPTAWGDSLPEDEVPAGPLVGPWSVGRGRPNGFGLLDAGTIVHEWCADWYDASYYAVSPASRPTGPDEGSRRSSRGGSWRHRVRWSPPAARSSLPPEFHYTDYGLRVLKNID